jgi:multidrug efflux pump subunit AcrA (membrane-fusion protein)
MEVYMFHNKRVFTAVSITILLALVLASCSARGVAQSGTGAGNFTGYGNVSQVSYTDTVESAGQIQPQHMTSLSFTSTGTVAQSNVQVGQMVNAGDMLMTLDPASVPANLLTAQTDLTNARNAYNQLTAPDLATISNAEKALSSAYTNYQQAEAALSNAIISNQGATDATIYKNWLDSKAGLDTAQNTLPLANASIDVQAYYQAVRDTSLLKAQYLLAEQNASAHPTDTVLAQKVTDLQAAVQRSQEKQNNLQAGLSSTTVDMANTLSDKLDAYDSASANFIGQVVTSTVGSNVNAAQIQADLTQKQSSLISAQSNLTDLMNKRAAMNGKRCTDATIADYQDIYNKALNRYNRSAHIVGSPEELALETAAANLNWCTSYWSASDIAAADANIASSQAQIQLLQAQIAADQAAVNDSGNSVYGLAINLNTVWAAYQDATQQLNSAVTTLFELERSPNPDDLAAAQAKVQSAQAEVNSLTLIAPYSGVVTSVGYQPGDNVSQSTPAVVLVDRSKLYVNLQIDESHVVRLSPGDQATITLEANPNASLTGKVAYINQVGTSNQGVVYYTVQVVLDQADPTILIGATADVTIQAGQPQTVLTVPVSAVASDSQGEYVYVIGSGGSAQQVKVVSGQILPDNTVIVSGNLKAGDSVGLLASTSTGTNNNFGGGGGRFLP